MSNQPLNQRHENDSTSELQPNILKLNIKTTFYILKLNRQLYEMYAYYLAWYVL